MKKIYVDCLSSMLRAALVNDGILEEIIIDDRTEHPRVGDIYSGKVEKILPSGMAFVNIGFNQPVFLQLTDFREKNKNVRCGDDIAVQVIKEGTDSKRAVVTTEISVSGRYAVLNIGSEGTGVSHKIENPEKRRLLKQTGERYCGDGIGVIMRTNCADADIADITAELDDLAVICSDLIKKINYSKAPSRIKKASDVVETAIRDLLTPGDEIVLNDIDEFKKICGGIYDCNVTLYDGSIPMFHNFGLEQQIEKALHSRVWLKCGGWLDISCTEAMTVIDVNSGKYDGSGAKVNMQAAEECARQIRLRNLSGMIVIDFINVKSERDNEILYETLSALVKKDRVKTCIVGMTELGLMELTRQKKHRPLHKIIGHRCPVCCGTGFVENKMYTADKIRNSIINIFTSTIYKRVAVCTDAETIDAVKGRDGCRAIEKRYGGRIEFKQTDTVRCGYYELEKYVE